MSFLLVLFQLVLSVAFASGENPCSSLVEPVRYHLFLADMRATVCAVIPNELTGGDIVLQPDPRAPHINGTFEVLAGNENGEFCTCQIEAPCQDPAVTADSLCDQLVVRPTASAIGLKNTFQMQYRNPPASPVNLTYDYAPPGIVFEGNESLLDGFGLMDTLPFRLRPFVVGEISICERQEDGNFTSSSMFESSIPMTDESCIIPSGSRLDVATVDLVLTGVLPDEAKVDSIFLTAGSCDNIMDSTLTSEIINVTIRSTAVTDAAITTTTTDTTSETTATGPTEGGPPLAIIIPAVAVPVVLLAAICIIIFCICKCNSRAQGSLDVTGSKDEEVAKEVAIEMGDIPVDKEDEKEKGPDNKTSKDVKAKSNNYVKVNCPPGEFSAAPVTGAIFLSNGDAQNYKDLEEELLAQHGCSRIQPVAMPPNHWQTTWREIASKLKAENCLVYVIWSGSLEDVNGNRNGNPPIRSIIQTLVDCPLYKNTLNKETVNHRVVLVQLGSKGTLDYIITPGSHTKVFWDVSAEDVGFDPKECSKYVCKIVSMVLAENERQVKNNTSNNAIRDTFTYDRPAHPGLKLGDGKHPPSYFISTDATDGKLLTTDDFNAGIQTLVSTINSKTDENATRVINHINSGVVQPLEQMQEQFDNQNIASKEEIQGD